MGEVVFDIEIHHDGVFKCDPRMKYTSGTMNVLSNVNSDFFGWFCCAQKQQPIRGIFEP